MWKIIAVKEIKSGLRDRSLYLVAAFLYILIAFAALTSYLRYRTYSADLNSSAELFKKEWQEQHANPHSAAHFGTYLFKPLTTLSLLEPGLSAYTGTTYRVEAHYQHLLDWSQADQDDGTMRFGELTVAMIFQLLMPLAIVALGYRSISGEQEQGTLKMLLSHQVKPVELLSGKILGTYLLLLMTILPVLLILAAIVLVTDFSSWEKLTLWIMLHLVYFFMVTAATVIISAGCRKSGSSLLVALLAWMLCTVILPRSVAFLTDRAHPLPSRHTFNEQLEQGYSKGIDGDKDRDGRYEDYKNKILKKYGADSVQNLPVNFDGLSMQNSEDYQSKVFKKYSGIVENILFDQQQLYELGTILSPYSALQQLSMGLSGTDIYHHVDFHRQAGSYRDKFIRKLNMDMAYSGSKYLTYDYQVGPEFFKNMAGFRYHQPDLTVVLNHHRPAFLGMIILLLALVLSIKLFAKNLIS